MKKIKMMRMGAVLATFFWASLAVAEEDGWVSDFAGAKKQAADSGKDLLVDFTGSDWCGWCIRLNHEVFRQEPFKKGVKDSLVLVELDYPRDKSKLSAEIQAQNQELGGKYAVKGYPTLLLCDATGKPFAATGYREGGPEKYVEHLDTLRKNKAVRDEAFASASKTDGIEKAKILIAALEAMGLEDSMVANFYGDVVAQIQAADPKDESGFFKAIAGRKRFEKFQAELNEIAMKGDFDGALALVDQTLKDGALGESATQQTLLTRAMIFARQHKFDEATKAADEAKAFAPNGELSADIDEFKTQLEEMKKEPSKEQDSQKIPDTNAGH